MSADVVGYCPMGCGETLFLAAGGHVTCSMIGCPNPTAVDDLLGDPMTNHVMTVTKEGFTLRHPLRERVGGQLENCETFDRIQRTPVGQWARITGILWSEIKPGAQFVVSDDLAMWWANS